MIEPSPYLSVEEVCLFMRIVNADGSPNADAFYAWKYRLKQRGRPLKTYRRGARLLVKRIELERRIEEEGSPGVKAPTLRMVGRR